MGDLSGTWNEERRTAESVALKAGRRLREEFYLPGGPRGERGKADVDDEVEVFIRQELLASFPSYRYLGEETGITPADKSASRHRDVDVEPAPIWIVDPNDGTSAFQGGYRGASISIALVVAGVPVVGVVYAYNAPTDYGDIFSWAEGEPLRRWSPGRQHSADFAVPAGQTAHDHVFPPVLISHKADGKALKNAEFTQPYRFRAVVGIACRLALTAAGEGAAAVTLTAPFSWDMAGGHALLRGAGYELYTADVEPVRYDEDGTCTPSPAYFGGRRDVVEHLAWKDWAEIFGAGSPERRRDTVPDRGGTVTIGSIPDGLSLAARAHPLTSDGTPVPPGLLDRAQGVLLGQCAGDSLGSLVESLTPDEITARYGDGPKRLSDGGAYGTIAGQPTDDTEMALLLARSIVAHRGYRREFVEEAYRWWLATEPFDAGGTVRSALEGHPRPQSQANGALMRISPMAIAAAGDISHLSKWEDAARSDAAITHVHENCLAVNVLYLYAVATAVAGRGEEDETSEFHAFTPGELYETVMSRASEGDIPDEVTRWTREAGVHPPEDYMGRQGWVRIAWQNTLYQLLNASNAASGVIDTVRRGGDTDTNAAVAGALLGAVYGGSGFPVQWRSAVSTARALPIRGVGRPRPPILFPVDWDILAERLLRTTGK